MTTHTPTGGPLDYVSVSKHMCPLCNGNVLRTHRRAIDRTISMFVPVRRYRCPRFSCQWEGNLDARSGAPDAKKDSPGLDGGFSKIPASFIVNMGVVVVGVVMVLVVPQAESFSSRELAATEPSASQVLGLEKLSGQGRPSEADSATKAPSAELAAAVKR